ncbi:BOI-related E3 ubiquitin-protein ligase 1-like [Olea europaea var. sylvestris]|uniref:BOI-related E3 ubiquitin-protein ligase 1-like n=1 Tax=Olea europaea var. sylvestris TaxID=158386 RepID=UPI000C1D3963|nr:BOI-related E3 ubiquitin-protein ligase 1-like [Olea europaea var. sylvestris]
MASFPPPPPPPPSPPPPPQKQQTKRFRDLYNNTESQISPRVDTLNLHDHHTPFMPPFQVEGLARVPVREENELDLQANFGLESKKKSRKAQDFLENSNNNNSQISCVEFLQAQPVSTGLGLSLEPTAALLRLVGDDLDRDLQRQGAETDRYIKFQGEQLRQTILEKVRATQLLAISYVENKVLQILKGKEAEVEGINKKNVELNLLMRRLSSEANAWQQRAIFNEKVINTLKINLQKAYAQNMGVKEVHGDSEVNDTASCSVSEMKKLLTCKVCSVNEVCMLLLPCKHLCLCKECESKLSTCPLCQSAKYKGVEFHM